MASIGRGARLKGASYERRIAKILSDSFDTIVRRTGGQERWKARGGDVNAYASEQTVVNDFQWECKNREAWAILDWFKKVKDETQGRRKVPVVVASKNFETDYVFMELADFLRVLKELDGYRKEANVS